MPVLTVPDRTMRRMTMPFVSDDRYGPKDVFEYLNHVVEPRRKFFHTMRRRRVFYKNQFFLNFCKKINFLPYIVLRGALRGPRKAGQLVIVSKVLIHFQELRPFARHRQSTSNLIFMFPLQVFESSQSFEINVFESVYKKF